MRVARQTPQGLLERHCALPDEIANRVEVIQRGKQHLLGKADGPGIAHQSNDVAVVGREERLAELSSMHFDFCVRLALETLDNDKIDVAQFRQQVSEARLVLLTQFVHQRPALY